jgi:dTDP-4-amino-4,6-dideoxygalactose transaminase
MSSTIPGVPLFDSQRQFQALADELLPALARVAASGRYILGGECETLERRLAEYCGAAHAVACASGSDALLLALLACGVGPGHEVIVPSYTFFATASAVTRLGARPVFAEIDPQSCNLDPADVARRVTPETRAIIPVHLYGQCAEMEPLVALARRHGLAVIEDACQAIGAEYRGRRAGALADVACFSFYPTKNLGGMGDGGMLTTDRPDLAHRLALLRTHGMRPRYHHHVVGINSRLDALQAAVLNVKLNHLESWTDRRRTNAARYAELFAARGLDGVLGLPQELPHRRHVWNQYVIRVPDGRRDDLQRHLTDRGIGTEIYYPVPLHLQPCFRDLGAGEGSLPETERAARETLALPIFPELFATEQNRVVEGIAEFFGRAQPPQAESHIPAPKFLSRGAENPKSEIRNPKV